MSHVKAWWRHFICHEWRRLKPRTVFHRVAPFKRPKISSAIKNFTASRATTFVWRWKDVETGWDCFAAAPKWICLRVGIIYWYFLPISCIRSVILCLPCVRSHYFCWQNEQKRCYRNRQRSQAYRRTYRCRFTGPRRDAFLDDLWRVEDASGVSKRQCMSLCCGVIASTRRKHTWAQAQTNSAPNTDVTRRHLMWRQYCKKA